MSQINVGDIVEARMAPVFTDDLSQGAQRIVRSGERLRWTAARFIDDEDSSTYSGQLRMELGRDDRNRTGVWWSPLCDLVEIMHVGVDDEEAHLHRLLNGVDADDEDRVSQRSDDRSLAADQYHRAAALAMAGGQPRGTAPFSIGGRCSPGPASTAQSGFVGGQ